VVGEHEDVLAGERRNRFRGPLVKAGRGRASQRRRRWRVVIPWTYPATKTGIAPEIVDRILTDIGRGLENGERYSNDNAATKRAAWKVIQKYCPDKPPKECKQVIANWLKQDLLYEDEYTNPVRHEKQIGLYVGEIRSNEI
jgi:hypothetical protein